MNDSFSNLALPLPMCQEDKIPCKYFCLDQFCKKPIRTVCAECLFSGQHKNHKYDKIEEI